QTGRLASARKVPNSFLPLGEYAKCFTRTLTQFAYQQPEKAGCWYVSVEISRDPGDDPPSSGDRVWPSVPASAWRRAPSATALPPPKTPPGSSSFLRAG